MVEADSTKGQPKRDSTRSSASSRSRMATKIQYCNCMSRNGLSKKVCASKRQNKKEKLQKNNCMGLLRSSLTEAQRNEKEQRVSEGLCPQRLTAGRQEGNVGVEALRWEVTSSPLPLCFWQRFVAAHDGHVRSVGPRRWQLLCWRHCFCPHRGLFGKELIKYATCREFFYLCDQAIKLRNASPVCFSLEYSHSKDWGFSSGFFLLTFHK